MDQLRPGAKGAHHLRLELPETILGAEGRLQLRGEHPPKLSGGPAEEKFGQTPARGRGPLGLRRHQAHRDQQHRR